MQDDDAQIDHDAICSGGLNLLRGKIYACGLVLGAKDLKNENFREGIEIEGATTFMNEIKDSIINFSF